MEWSDKSPTRAWAAAAASWSHPDTLVFLAPPTSSSLPYARPPDIASTTSYTLDPMAAINEPHIRFVSATLEVLHLNPCFKAAAEATLNILWDSRGRVWDTQRQKCVEGNSNVPCLEAQKLKFILEIRSKAHGLSRRSTLWLRTTFIVLSLDQYTRISRRALKFLLLSLRTILFPALSRTSLDYVPSDIRTLRKAYGLHAEDRLHRQVVCTTCFCAYDLETLNPLEAPLRRSHVEPLPPFAWTVKKTKKRDATREQIVHDINAEELPKPQPRPAQDPAKTRCTFRSTRTSDVCGAKLFKQDRFAPDYDCEDVPGLQNVARQGYLPIRNQYFRRLKPWLHDLFKRPGLVASLHHVSQSDIDTTRVTDIWESAGFRALAADGGILCSENRGYPTLVLVLFVDWWNPHTNKLAGKQHSDGSVTLALLNLPAHLRFHHDHLFSYTSIPGPGAPSMEQINHCLRPLVDELVVGWEEGMVFDDLPIPGGVQKYSLVLIPLVTDMEANSRVAGRVSCNHGQFPCLCGATKSTLGSVEPRILQKRHTVKEHRRIAEAWKHAMSPADRRFIDKNYGIRYSELLRLRYWNPLEWVPIEGPHNLLLGIIHKHIRHRMAFAKPTPDGMERATETPAPSPKVEQLQTGRAILSYRRLPPGSSKALMALSTATLWALAHECGLDVGPWKKTAVKRSWVQSLLSWVGILCLASSASVRLTPSC